MSLSNQSEMLVIANELPVLYVYVLMCYIAHAEFMAHM